MQKRKLLLGFIGYEKSKCVTKCKEQLVTVHIPNQWFQNDLENLVLLIWKWQHEKENETVFNLRGSLRNNNRAHIPLSILLEWTGHYGGHWGGTVGYYLS